MQKTRIRVSLPDPINSNVTRRSGGATTYPVPWPSLTSIEIFRDEKIIYIYIYILPFFRHPLYH
jgi:hypothetical protein